MKKKLVKILSFLLLGAMICLLLVGCTNLNSVEKKLRDAGYTVTRLGKGAEGVFVDAADPAVESTVRGTAGPNGEWITVIRFKEREKADEFYHLQYDSYKDQYFMTVKKDGKTVIYGWTAAYNVIK